MTSNPMHATPNIFILAVVRSADKTVVASYLRSNEVTVEGVRECIASNPSMVRGKRYSATGPAQTIHYTLDPQGRVFSIVTAPKYPLRIAFAALDELQEMFNREIGIRVASATEGSLSRPAAAIFKHIYEKYENPAKVDKLTSVQEKVDVVKSVMKENIQQVLANTEKMEDIEAATEQLRNNANEFKGRSKQVRDAMWWKMWKMRLLIGGLVTSVLLIIILSFTLSSGSSKK
eukprot:gene14269-10200_t